MDLKRNLVSCVWGLDELKPTAEEKEKLVAAVDFKRLSESTLQVLKLFFHFPLYLPRFLTILVPFCLFHVG